MRKKTPIAIEHKADGIKLMEHVASEKNQTRIKMVATELLLLFIR